MPRKKTIHTTEEELKSAVVAACLRELNETFDHEVRQGGGVRDARWTAEDSKYLCNSHATPEGLKAHAANVRASEVFLKVRDAILAFETWARDVEASPPRHRWPTSGILEHLGPVLLPFVREPSRFRYILSEDYAQSMRHAAAPLPQWEPRERVVRRLDHPLIGHPNELFDAFGFHRPATDRELALILLSAGHFPRLSVATESVGDVIGKERKTVAAERERLWLFCTSNRYRGPKTPVDTPRPPPDPQDEAADEEDGS